MMLCKVYLKNLAMNKVMIIDYLYFNYFLENYY